MARARARVDPARNRLPEWAAATGRSAGALGYYELFGGLRFTGIMLRVGKPLAQTGLVPPGVADDNLVIRALAERLLINPNTVARAYREGLAGLPGLALPEWPGEDPGSHVFHQFTVRAAERDGLREALARALQASGGDAERIEGLEQPLQSLTSEVAELAQRHLAFPVLHYFHRHRTRHSGRPQHRGARRVGDHPVPRDHRRAPTAHPHHPAPA